ncbi:hypothetical protein MJO29_013419 [Puccinia striiformis f. sp. tritici]|uniref:Uncharacterized protein n=2 Tax=Puccinia striiformis TaxID=27350 RepID=A0A2S4VYC9_9BASI|nr:hypothetical protein MJO29_013419 [Puccinia striiformis f. sp. tritici]POW14489.1 hypothetical protein PSTT_02962 [Puccinia striiformis]
MSRYTEMVESTGPHDAKPSSEPGPVAMAEDDDIQDLKKAVIDEYKKAGHERDGEKAEKYSKMYGSLLWIEMVREMTKKEEELYNEPAPKPENSDGATQGGLLFVNGAVNTHDGVGLPAYFEHNIRELSRQIPLTIFNREWQEQALQCQNEKRFEVESSGEEDARLGYTDHQSNPDRPSGSRW